MNKCRITALLALLLVLSVGQAVDAGVRKSGLTGAAFLKIGVGARPVALASAYTTVTGDVNQLFYNPAGTALGANGNQVTLFHNEWIADLSHDAVGYVRDVEGIGTIGVSLVTLGLSDINSDRDAVPQFVLDTGTFIPNDTRTSGSYNYRDLALGLTWARHVTNRLDMGITGKIISQSIDSETARAYALDLGAIYRIDYQNTKIGARINNLGSDIEFYDIGAPLPLVFSIGASSDVYANADQGMKVTVLADATKAQDSEQLLFGGVEVQVMEMLQLRSGYKLNYQGIEDEKVDEANGGTFDAPRTEEGLSAGLGVGFSMAGYDATVDYAFTEFGILDSVHRFSLQVAF